jgi:uncharacterized membrane protein YdjX (TVP38/TMEM64 family)
MPETKKGAPWLKIVVGLVVIAAIVMVVRMLPVGTWLRDFQAYVRAAGPIGYVTYALVYAICCVLFIPASILTLGAGAIFGLVAGTAVVVVGATLGAVASFLLARSVMRKRIESMTAGNAKFAALDRAIAKEGAKIVFLIRLSPIFPFTYINYAFGLTGVRTWPYALATLVGIIPGTFAYVYLGYAGAGVVSGQANKLILIAGLVIAFIVAAFIAYVAKRAIKNAGVDEAAAPPPAALSTTES